MENEHRSQATLENLTAKVGDLAGTVTELAHAMKEGFTNVEERFTRIDQRFDKVEGSIGLLHEGQENIKDRLVVVEQGISKLTVRVEEMNDTLESTANLASDHADKLTNHEGRITRFEKAPA